MQYPPLFITIKLVTSNCTLDTFTAVCETHHDAPCKVTATMATEYKAPDPWDPIRVKNVIDMELNFGSPSLTEGESESTNTTPEAIAKDHARRSLPVAMDSIIYLATYSENETLRLKASTYLVDRVLGRITDIPIENIVDDSDPLTQLVKKAMGATSHAN